MASPLAIEEVQDHCSDEPRAHAKGSVGHSLALSTVNSKIANLNNKKNDSSFCLKRSPGGVAL